MITETSFAREQGENKVCVVVAC